MKLVIVEKPSVAIAYAKVLGAVNRYDGYYNWKKLLFATVFRWRYGCWLYIKRRGDFYLKKSIID
ncbi:hypothetical protein [Chakrabartyella piscis]|uniref:hypothetical protein n=1 Tax=Chakrabartyella piscis TaxID=2918914 RepID=UPI002958C1DA|nr:hypothetical protein [Chakrabartyella piscis]